MVDEQPAFILEPAPVLPPSRRVGRRGVLVAAVVFVVAVAIVATGLVATGRVTAPWVRPVQRVVIVDPDGALAVLDAQGGNRVVHQAAGTTFTFPAWSPDGTRVAAVAQTPDGVAVEVFAADPAGKVLYESSSSAPFYLYWTPDGGGVTFLTEEGSSLALRLAPADASAPATVLHQGAPMYWAWDGHNRMLVHAGGNEGELFLGELASDGSTVGTIAGTPGDFRSPAVSADGRFQAYAVTHDDGTGALVVAAADGSSRHEVQVFGPSAFGFAPDGGRLAFVGPAQGDPRVGLPLGVLRVLDAATGEARKLLDREVVAFFWAPDGRTIAAIAVSDQVGPGAADAGGRARTASVTTGGPADPPRVAGAPGIPASLVFVDAASGAVRSERPVQLSELFVNQVLPYFDQYALSHRVWSPDGASILLPLVANDGTGSLAIIPADGSAQRILAPGSMGFWSP